MERILIIISIFFSSVEKELNDKASFLIVLANCSRQELIKFADNWSWEEISTDWESVFEREDIDIIDIATPTHLHHEMAIKAAKCGKHIFCEKPLAENYKDAKEMCDALKNKNLINMVNFSYRNSSGYQELVKTVQSGKIGNIMHMDANYYQSWLSSKYWGDWKTEDKWLWRLSTNHGSMGTLGDIGVHIFDFASFPIGPIKKLNAKIINLY